MNTITFPNLNLKFNINPIAFHIGDKAIYWYGIIIMSGILLALILAHHKIKKMNDIDKLSRKLSWDLITDLVLFMIPIGIVFARLYYCIFNWDYYGKNLLDIFKIWNGGLAIYGGVIGGIFTGIVFCKVKKVQFFDLADFCIPYVAMCQSIGRWGNFVNAEAYGEATDSFFKMGIDNSGVFYHPTFLYESVCTFLIFLILSKIDKNKKFIGQTFYLYFILYGVARFFIEGLRTDSLYVANTSIRASQALSLLLFVVFTILYIYKRFNIRAKIEKHIITNGR